MAYKLADEHLHLWALKFEWDEYEAIIDGAATPGKAAERIRTAVRAVTDEIGIDAPYWDEAKGAFVHTTGTGRLTWEIAWGDDNAPVLTITVSRPSGDAFYVIADEDSVEWKPVIGAAFCTRHLEAAMHALKAAGFQAWGAPYNMAEIAKLYDALDRLEMLAHVEAKRLAMQHLGLWDQKMDRMIATAQTIEEPPVDNFLDPEVLARLQDDS